jgi:hypothetical protein
MKTSRCAALDFEQTEPAPEANLETSHRQRWLGIRIGFSLSMLGALLRIEIGSP